MPPPTPENDTTCLVGRLRNGCDDARSDLIAYSYDKLRNVASRIMGKAFTRLRRWEQTDDVLQNAQIRLHRALATYAPESSASFYNLAAKLIRRELQDLTRHHFGPQGQGANHHSNDGEPADRPDPRSMRSGGGEPASEEERASIRAQVEALPPELRDVVRTIWYEGKTQQEAANALGVSVSTLRRRKRNALLLLAHALKGRAAG